jgi:hypothetical protein
MARPLGLALAVAGATMIGATLIGAGSANAQTDWRRVHLADESTLDIPAVVGDEYKVPAELAQKGDLMFFAVNSGPAGELDCLLRRTLYGPGLPGAPTRQDMFKTLDSKVDRLSLCAGRGDSERQAINEGGSLKGYPSGRCVVGYTATGQDAAAGPGTGRVVDSLTLAAPGGYYTLGCTLHAADQRTAEREWFNDWRHVIEHMQGSLLVP